MQNGRTIGDDLLTAADAGLSFWQASTVPQQFVDVYKNSKIGLDQIKKNGLKGTAKGLKAGAKQIAIDKIKQRFGKLGAKWAAKHAAAAMPAATGVGAVTVPVLEAAMLGWDLYDLYELAKDKKFREDMKYLSQDVLDGAKSVAKGTLEGLGNLGKNAKAKITSALSSAKSKAKNSLTESIDTSEGIFPVATMPDGTTKYSDGSIR